MRQIVRALWVARALGSIAVLAPALALIGTSPLAWPALGLGLLMEAWGAVTLQRYLTAVQDGSKGELLMANGARVPVAVLRGHHQAERLGHATGCVVAAVALVVVISTHHLLVAAVTLAALLVQLVLIASRWTVWQQHRAYHALMSHQPEAALKRLRPFRKLSGPMGRAIAHTRASALAQVGQPDAGQRELEAVWAGDLDATAALLGIARVRRGDTELARQWLAAEHPDDRFHRYLRAMVGGTLALQEGQAEAALAASEVALDVPAYQQRELDLVAAAALQLGGRGDEARVRLASLRHMEREAWRAEVQPLLWSLVDDALAGRTSQGGRAPISTSPPPQRPQPSDAFAAPAAPPSPARWRGLQVGAIPYESSPLGPAGERFPWVRRAMVLLLLVLAVLLGALWGLLSAVGEGEPQLTVVVWIVEALVAIVVVVQGSREWLAAGMRRDGEGMTLADGRVLPSTPWWLRWQWALSPVLVMTVLLPLPVLEWLMLGTVISVVLVGLLAALVWLATRRRAAAMRAAVAVHEAPPSEVVSMVQRHSGLQTTGWLYLAHLVAGDLDGAQQVVEEHVAILPQLAELGMWLRAAKGHVSLDQLLQQEPVELGDRYRHAVAVRLAALASGQAHRVPTQGEPAADIAAQLPNRFGGLLLRLQLEVLRAASPEQAADYERTHAEGLQRGDWVPPAWLP